MKNYDKEVEEARNLRRIMAEVSNNSSSTEKKPEGYENVEFSNGSVWFIISD